MLGVSAGASDKFYANLINQSYHSCNLTCVIAFGESATLFNDVTAIQMATHECTITHQKTTANIKFNGNIVFKPALQLLANYVITHPNDSFQIVFIHEQAEPCSADMEHFRGLISTVFTARYHTTPKVVSF